MILPLVRKSRQRRGIAATELVFLVPFLVFIFLMIVDFSRIFYYTISLEYAARDGAYYGSNYPGLYSYDDTSATQFTNIQNAALGESSNISPSPTVSVGYDTQYNGTYSSSTSTGANFIQVQVTYTFNTITSFPGIPTSTTITRSSRMAMAPITPN